MFRVMTIGLSSLFLLSACASGTFKARQEQRDKMAAASGLYCEFVNGDKHPDIDVELNLQVAKRCDANGNLSITNYRNSSEQSGVVYCCSTQATERSSSANISVAPSSTPSAPAKKDAKGGSAAPAEGSGNPKEK